MLALAIAIALSTPTALPAEDPNAPTNQASKDARMKWWREARFGMFIHWGLYSILEGEWNGNKNHAEWIRETAHIPIAEYEKLLGRFNPVKFDADAWAKMAKDAGMKYLVITSKHHDGFNLFDSPFTEWDVMSTPFKRDIMKELSEACKRQGIRFAMYHSIMDWHHPDYLPKRSWEGSTWRASTVNPVGDAFQPNFDRFVTYLRNEVAHIIKNYHPGILWFDGEWESTWTHEYGKPLYDLCLATDPNIIVNNRVDVSRGGMEGMSQDTKSAGDYGTPEQTIPANGIPGMDWETCMTMNGNWGYNAADKNFKSTKQMIHMLVDIASKGGNYLMNIGPKPDGTFPEESVQRLKEIGMWMRDNGESIYGTGASVFKKLTWGRCTTKKKGANTMLYLSVFDWPKGGKLVVPGIGNQVVTARRLGTRSKLATRRAGSDIAIDVGAEPVSECPVIALEVRGVPVVYEAPEIVSPALEFVNSISVEIKAGPGLEVFYTTDGSDPVAGNRSNQAYRGPLSITKSGRVRARTYHQGKPVSGVTEAKFAKVLPKPAKDVNLEHLNPGLEVRLFEGDWNTLPELYFKTDYTSKTLPNFTIADDPQKEFCGRFYVGMVEVPADDMYVFALSSDDGSRLWVDGDLVVDNNGLHSALEKSGSHAMAKGWHNITVEWFNKTGGAQLSLKMARIGEKLAPIPDSRLKH